MILYSLGNILGSYHKTKFTNTYEKYAHKFDTNLSPYAGSRDGHQELRMNISTQGYSSGPKINHQDPGMIIRTQE